MAERRKKQQAVEAPRPEHVSVGEMLRGARLARQLDYEDVSVSIHIRPSQLKAIEENDIDSLPGMTYAVGFVRSYANFLGLNGAEVVHRFKAEHGHDAASTKLAFPEPITESRVPDPMMVGIGAFFAVVILVIWTVYTTMQGSKTADDIPPAPEVASMAPAETPAAMTPAPDAAMSTPTTASPVPPAAETAAPAAVAVETTAPVVAEAPAAQAVAPATPTAPAAAPVVADVKKEDVKKEDVKKAEAPAAKPAPTTTAANDDAADEGDDDEAKAEEVKADKKKKDDAVINVKKGKSRIVLKATQASWIQVSDASQNIIYRKVLRPGEQYAVPDQPGLSLDTANAGGLDVVVDGKEVQSIGRAGEILRGVAMDPKELKIQRIKVRN